MKYRLILYLFFSLFLLSCKDNVSYELPEYELNLSVLRLNHSTAFIYLSAAGDINLQDISVQHNESFLPHRQDFLDDIISDRFYFSDTLIHQTNTIKVTYEGNSATFEYAFSDLAATFISDTAKDTIIDGVRVLYNQPFTLNFNNKKSPDYYILRWWYEEIENGYPYLVSDEIFTVTSSLEIQEDFAPLFKDVHFDVSAHWGPLPTEDPQIENNLFINFRLISKSSFNMFFIHEDF